MGSSRDGHWLEKEERNSRSLFNLLGLFGGTRHPHPQLHKQLLSNETIAAQAQEIGLMRWRANMGNQRVCHCRIGRITIKALK